MSDTCKFCHQLLVSLRCLLCQPTVEYRLVLAIEWFREDLLVVTVRTVLGDVGVGVLTRLVDVGAVLVVLQDVIQSWLREELTLSSLARARHRILELCI